MGGDQEGRRRIGQSPQSLQRRAVLNTLSIKENESLLQRCSSLFQGGFVTHIQATRDRPQPFGDHFAHSMAQRTKEGREGTRIRRRGSNVAPLVSPCKAGYVGRVGGRGRARAGGARSRNAPKGNETADPFGPSAKAIAVTAHPRLCMPPEKAEKMESLSFTLVHSLSRRGGLH